MQNIDTYKIQNKVIKKIKGRMVEKQKRPNWMIIIIQYVKLLVYVFIFYKELIEKMVGVGIYHPNIDFSSGSVCLDVINQTWTPMYELLNIFEVFLPQLLTYPNPASPLNQEAAHLYESQIQKYNEKVKQYINKYALNNELVQIRKKSEELLMIETQKSKEDKSKKQVEDEHSMDEEGSSLSDRNSIMDDQDLKLY